MRKFLFLIVLASGEYTLKNVCISDRLENLRSLELDETKIPSPVIRLTNAGPVDITALCRRK